ncbi:trypsin-like serine protease [Marivita sp. XM-24bin2]|uniref:trypsin-like serine peptidase n=1 Tax=unclassified Marivita TaxID=2632480 RepID=UPI000D7B3570|nr:trypsin-like serine protease [Marivita sp. XM-24bin2]MCR9108018.1 trypsin-like serine protease [Paracoccaceae bacterium]PWL34586.1 MAG: trypsin [Marivita sp. XM-24bin2]
MRSLLGLLLCLATTAAAQGLPLLPAKDHAAWQAVGRVNAAGYRKREMCSGTLIAPDKVLTAAHCVAGTDGLGPLPEDFTFVAGWLRGTAADSIAGKSLWVHPRAYNEGQLDIRFDVALLTLERPSEIAPLPLVSSDPATVFGILGYSTRRPHMLGAAFECAGNVSSAILRLNCPVTAGNSGGPVVARTGEGWAVAGVISAMGRDGALAVPVSRLTQR